MMYGKVDQNFEVMIHLVVGDADSKRHTIDALIDTGFTGFLSLPMAVISDLNLKLCEREEGTLGDGSLCTFDVYRGFVIWDGQLRRIDVNAAEITPLVGMSLLKGYRMQLDAIVGREVSIRSLISLE